MSSISKTTESRRARHHSNEGQRRKRVESAKSTPSYDEQFAGCGEPGKPVKAAKK